MKNVATEATSRAKQIDSQYHVVDRTRDGLQAASAKAKQINQDYKIDQRIGTTVKSGWSKIQSRYDNTADNKSSPPPSSSRSSAL